MLERRHIESYIQMFMLRPNPFHFEIISRPDEVPYIELQNIVVKGIHILKLSFPSLLGPETTFSVTLSSKHNM